MAILAIGGTGMIGSHVVEELARRGAEVRAFGSEPSPRGAPAGVEEVIGDIFDIELMRRLLREASTVFVLNPAVADELARVLLTLSLIDEAKIQRVVYLSMMGVDRFTEASRAAAKLAAEQTIRQLGLPTTILRPNAVFQNDVLLKDAITRDHRYATPLGSVGITVVDLLDVAEVAAIELLRREQSATPLPTEVIEVVGPEAHTGQSIVRLWSDVLGENVTYEGDDLDAVEQRMRGAMPAAGAYDLKLVFRGILREGVLGAPGAAERLVSMLGRPLRTYHSFARTLAGASSGA